MDPSNPRIGFYGKLPSHGDFVRRALPSELTKPWDAWLQSGLAASRELLGDAWLECYLSAPIWRFCLSAGICGEMQWMGAIMPSVDRVGRYFPLTAATGLAAGHSLFAMATAANPWFVALEETMLGALEEDSLAADDLEKRLATIEPHDGAAGTVDVRGDRQLIEEDGCLALALANPGSLADAPGSLADAMARRSCGGFSLWWTAGSAHVAPGARVFRELPAAETFWTLLRGDRPPD